MHAALARKRPEDLTTFAAASQRIIDVQLATGAIPWFEDGPWDPWNHVECAMALAVMGHWRAAQSAYDYLAGSQRSDGAWLGEYGNALPMVDRDYISREKSKALIDSNFCAYPAVGVAHYLMLTGDLERVRGWWPMIRRGIDFLLTLQRADGTFSWSLEAVGTDQDDALRAGNCSIAKSLECACFLAAAVGVEVAAWREAHAGLLAALRLQPDAFDLSGKGRRFAMDWYYPALSGALSAAAAREQLVSRWTDFVDPALGCRCVADEPWITVAETAELAMALLSIGERKRAADLFAAVLQHRDAAGVFWMGWQYEEQTIWPREQPTWTQAAVILAADALTLPAPERGTNPLVRRVSL